MSRFERWSRRKRGLDDGIEAPPARAELAEESTLAPAPVTTDVNSPDDAGAGAVGESRADDDIEVSLPDPETLDPNGDFKAYLAPGVSPALRRRALRRMFTASCYNVRDGLDDYDQDFTQIGDLSREVASRLRRWMTTPDEDDQDGIERDDTAPAEAPPELADAEPPIAHEHDASMQRDDDGHDPSRPMSGTV